MRPSALLTGLTGVVAVLVIIYVGLTAFNLQPHITFGDPDRTIAAVDTRESATPSASTVAASEKPAPAAMPTPSAVAVVPSTIAAPAAPASVSVPPAEPEKEPLAVVAAPPAAAPAPATPAQTEPTSTAADRMKQVGEALAASTAPAPPAKPAAGEAVETLPVPEIKPSEAPDVAADVKTHPLAEPPAPQPPPPTEKIAKSDDVAKPEPLPPLAMIPTPQQRPEPAKEEAKAAPMAEVAPEKTNDAPIAATNAPKPVEEASLPPKEAAASAKPAEPAPASETAKLEAAPDLKPVDLSRPLAERAGVLTIGNRIIQLADIQPTDPAMSCTGPNGKEWPCGTLARTALRAFLLGRTVTCDVPNPQWTGSVTAVCRFARVDLSDWLARNGWAEPASGSSLMAVADQARKDGLGIYGNDPRKKHVSTLAPEPPKEDPLNPI